MRRLREIAAVSLAALVAAAACFASPSLADLGGARTLTFAGRCQLTGTSSFSSRVSLMPAPVRNDVVTHGTCPGTVMGRNERTTQINSLAVQYRRPSSGRRRSWEADPNAVGDGELIFREGKLYFHVVENRLGGQAACWHIPAVPTLRRGDCATSRGRRR